jgi:hypothetical protein
MRTRRTLSNPHTRRLTLASRVAYLARAAVNRLLARSARPGAAAAPLRLPELPGRPLLDVSDASALLAALDNERRAQRGIP